jgi:hypothetical protein
MALIIAVKKDISTNSITKNCWSCASANNVAMIL